MGRQFIIGYLRPFFAQKQNGIHIAEMLFRIEGQLQQITDEADYHVKELELRYKDGVQKAKQVMLARECLKTCILEVHHLHVIGILDDHAYGELQQYLEDEMSAMTQRAIGPVYIW